MCHSDVACPPSAAHSMLSRQGKSTRLPTECVLMLMMLLRTLGASPEFWALITNPAHSWGLKTCWQLWSFQVLAYNSGCQALTSKSVSPQIHKLINKHLHVIMQKVWWGSGVEAHSFLPSPELLGHAWRKLDALVWLLLVFSFLLHIVNYLGDSIKDQREAQEKKSQVLYTPQDHLSKELCSFCGYGAVFSHKTSL